MADSTEAGSIDSGNGIVTESVVATAMPTLCGSRDSGMSGACSGPAWVISW